MWKLILLLFLYKIVPAIGLPNESDTGCVLNITGSQDFTECVMGFYMYISNASSFMDLSNPYSLTVLVCSTEGQVVFQCILDYVNSCPDLMSSGTSSSMMLGFQALEELGGLESYCNTMPAFDRLHGCTLLVAGNQSFIECMTEYSMLISYASSFIDLNDPDTMMAVMCSTEEHAAMQCVLGYVQSCPDLMKIGNSSSVLQSLQEIEQFGGLESHCNSSSAISLSPGCALDIAGNQSFVECVMEYSMLMSNATNFLDVNDPNAMTSVMCSMEGQAAMRCVLGYVKACPDLINSGNSSSMLPGLHALEQFGGLETYCNTTSGTGLPHGCALDIAGNQSFIECVMGYSMLMSNATNFVNLNDPNSMTSVICSTEGKAAVQCVVEYVKSCPDLMNSGNSSFMLQGLQALDQFGGLETYCDTTPEVICNPDDSIDMYNLPADYYYFGMQNMMGGPDVQCTVTNINSTAVTITGCAKDLPILLTFGTYSGMEANAVHGGKSMIAVTIKCNEIPETGSVHSVRNSFNASLSIDEKTTIKPYYEVASALNISSVTVGSPVKWTISFPREYILEVTECKAFPGTSSTSSNSVTLVSNGGCNAISELISHFTDNLDGTASAIIAAFKFHQHDNVFLTCDLKICPNASSSCNFLSGWY